MSEDKQTKYRVWNDTDGIPARAELFNNSAEACEFINQFRRRTYTPEGYKTADGRFIDPMQVEMHIEEVDAFEQDCLETLEKHARSVKSVPIHDAYGDGVSPDTFSDIIDKLDTTTLHNDIEIMVVCESTGKKYKALADVMMSENGTLCISGIKHDDEAIAQECMEKFMEMLQFKAGVDACGNFAEYWTAQHGLDEYIEEFGVWCALRKYFADYIAEARKFKRRGCKKDCVRATWGDRCEGKCEWPLGEDDDNE
jgi:hypothetical protein